MRAVRSTLGLLTLAAVLAALTPPAPAAAKRPAGPLVVVAHIDTGVNPYAPAFRDRSPIAYQHPSTYIPGYPKDVTAVKLTLDKPFEDAWKADEAKWKSLRRGELYWFPGTKIIGAISMSAGGEFCPTVKLATVNAFTNDDTCSEHVIFDDHGHGTMTGSRSTGIPDSLAPEARLVTIEGLGAGSVKWAADQGWIDVQTNSWLSLVPPPIPSGTTEAFAAAAEKMVTIAASGNGAAYLAGFVPTPTYVLSTAPPGVILVGGHDNGLSTIWAGAPPHVVADAYMPMSAATRSVEPMHPEIMACCTSAAAPYGASGAAVLILEARKILGDNLTGVRGSALACGPKNKVKSGPLADGNLTLEEFNELYFHTAEAFPAEGKDDGAVHWSGGLRPPDQVEYGPGGNPYCFGCTTTPVPWSAMPAQADGAAYQFVGYGGINERSVKLGIDVLRGKTEMPARAAADAQYDLDQQLRAQFFAANGSDTTTVEYAPPAC
ncbi:MAG: S8/S53 family peptidase [Actinomycetota bacterium]|nr:S8/S53 family peptidase [Actinomycetota bacterium]